MTHLLGKRVCDAMEKGVEAQEAVESVIKFVNREYKRKVVLAVIALDKDGNVGAARNVDLTPHAFLSSHMKCARVNFAPLIR